MEIHLQQIGKHYAIPAKDLKPGQTRVYSFVCTGKIVSVEPLKSGKSLRLTTRENGKLYTSTVRTSTLIAVKK